MTPAENWLNPLLAAVTLTPKNIYWFRRSLASHREQVDWENETTRDRIERWLADWLYRAYYTSGEPVAVAGVSTRAAVVFDFAKIIAAAAGDGLRKRLNYSPGFMMIRPDSVAETVVDHKQIRLYWNVTPQNADDFVRILTRKLDITGWDYGLKILNDPDAYGRADSAVLYLRPGDADDIARFLDETYSYLQCYLRSATPAMTRRLGFGLAVAESPDEHGTSFGLNRTALLAQGLIAGRTHRPDNWKARRSAVALAFAEQGLDAKRPYLGIGRDDYYCPVSATRPSISMDFNTTSEMACSMIIDALKESAVRSKKACTWWRIDRSDTLTSTHCISQTVGSDLYKGTSGISLFLAEYAIRSRDRNAHLLAEGACHSVIDDLDAGALEAASGLYSGPLGALFGVLLVANRLASETLKDRMVPLIHHVAYGASTRTTDCHDVISGRAGEVFALLGIARLLEAPGLIDIAKRFGHQLVDSARWSDGGISWSSADMEVSADLTGFSHGTAGISTALLELYLVTGVTDFRRTAHAGFEYERRTYDPELGNWPDFRKVYRHKSSDARLVRTNTAWCHGAGGIALSRLHALSCQSDNKLHNDANRAFSALRSSVRMSVDIPDTDLGLCHGLAGNIAILAKAQGTEYEADGDASLIVRGRAAIAARICAAEPDTLCNDPGMMTGISGPGWLLAAGRDMSNAFFPLLFSKAYH